ncbi:FAD-dependent monooxygenase [Nucisporomicrobium flavum]|uniref:FAD-dependent monooxygenase n=1 Tax=Nucisporomicrobium flavum TaxID=2785915 RepID=UPI003C2EC97E
MTSPTALISGAGVAGPALAYWLARQGWSPTVIERAEGLRSSGNPVDVRGPALPVVEDMGLVPRLRAAATHARSMLVLDPDGRPGVRVGTPASRSAAGTREIELPRADLAGILHDAAAPHAEFRFDDTITTLRQDAGGVDVTFERGRPGRFDVVIGADGLHSTVRRLAFGPESAYVRHLGVYVATIPWRGALEHPHDVVMYNLPGRLVSVHPCAGEAMAAFIFRRAAVAGFDHRDTDRQRRILSEAYAGAGWIVPQLLAEAGRTTQLYFDSVSRVAMPAWSRGRIALLGDAASCVSLFGDGSSLAIAGARTLADALAGAHGDPAAAFARYEREHRRLTRRKQVTMHAAAALIVPRTRAGIAVRNFAARTLLRPAPGGPARTAAGRD